jgi:hypothetical protein
VKVLKIAGLSLAVLTGLIILSGIILFIINPDVVHVMIYKIQYKEITGGQQYAVTQTKEIKKPHLQEENFASFERYNLKFTLPFDKSDISVVKDTSDTFVALCGNDIAFTLVDHRSMNDMITKSFTQDNKNYQVFRNLFGEEPLKSDFEFVKFLLEKRTGRIDFLSTNKDVVVNEVASNYAEIFAGKNPVIFNTPEVKGFQNVREGSPKTYFQSIYDNKNNSYTVMITGDNVTDEEADYMLASIQSLN